MPGVRFSLHSDVIGPAPLSAVVRRLEAYMTRGEIEACWRDPRNHKWGVYYCKADPRAIVPRRLKWMGWTVNFARPSAIPITLLLIALVAAPLLIVKAKGA